MASKKNLRLFPRHDVTVLDLGSMEIWDGADLALLRESLTRLVVYEKCRGIGIDMSHVKYIPSGFFGMLFDYYEQGVRIRLFSPQPNVQRMLWFNRFFEIVTSDGCYELRPEGRHVELPTFPTGTNGHNNGHTNGVNGSARAKTVASVADL